jgi:hypothetical protein
VLRHPSGVLLWNGDGPRMTWPGSCLAGIIAARHNSRMIGGNGKHPLSRVHPIQPLRHAPGEEVKHSVLGYSRVWFTRHAIDRMNERNVSREEALSVLEHPTQKGLKTQRGRFRWRKKRTAGTSIDVVFEKWPDKVCIVTVMVIQGTL